jgi:hypothetical protein
MVDGIRRGGSGAGTIRVSIKRSSAKGRADLAGAKSIAPQLVYCLMSVVCVVEEPYHYVCRRPHVSCVGFISHENVLCASNLKVAVGLLRVTAATYN